jgi:hypothetical protein
MPTGFILPIEEKIGHGLMEVQALNPQTWAKKPGGIVRVRLVYQAVLAFNFPVEGGWMVTSQALR